MFGCDAAEGPVTGLAGAAEGTVVGRAWARGAGPPAPKAPAAFDVVAVGAAAAAGIGDDCGPLVTSCSARASLLGLSVTVA